MNIKFLCYVANCSCLCNGVLTLQVNKKEITFGDNKCKYNKFWYYDSSINEKYNKNIWLINQNKLPKFLKPYTKELEILINENIKCSYCEGCTKLKNKN